MWSYVGGFLHVIVWIVFDHVEKHVKEHCIMLCPKILLYINLHEYTHSVATWLDTPIRQIRF